MRFWKMKKKYRVKKNAPKVQPKKNPNKDMRQYSFIFFLIGLISMIGLADYALNFKTFLYPEVVEVSTTEDVAMTGGEVKEEEDEFKVLQIEQEEIENLVNTIAYTHAQWPGYKGDPTDGKAVRKHFSNNLANYIIKYGRPGEILKEYKIHFYYVVRDDGNIQFLAVREGGLTSEDLPVRLVESTSKLMNIGVPGITAGTDDKGEPITVIYELLITFTQS